jgi:peptidoglycan/LPS O-acetylase OafA/YrhL
MSGVAGHRPRLTHQPALDGLRGLAVAGVLLFHGGHLSGGFLGVDAFFVLSGFLITSLLLAEARGRGGVALGAFWARRARRLLPALACVMVAVALYAAFLAKPAELTTIRGDALATIAYIANWRAIASSHDYWALFRSPSPLDHTWSLSIEEQFYVVWPLVIALLVVVSRARLSARRVLIVSGVLAIVSFAWSQIVFDPGNPSRVYYGTDTRVASILIGAALAAWLAERGEVRSRGVRIALEVVAIAGFAVLLLAWARLSGSSTLLYRGGLFGCAVATAIVIAAAVHPKRGPLNRVLSFGPLCALGLISYGVYLWHWPIYIVLDQSRVHLGGWPLLAVQIVVTLAVAVVSFRLVERPIRRGTGVWAAPRVRTVIFASVTALAVVVAAIVVSTARAPAPETLQADPIRTYVPPSTTTPTTTTPTRGVRQTAPTTVAPAPVAVPRILVVGDSIALYDGDEGFKQLRTTPPLDVLNLGSVDCRFLPEESRWRDIRNGELQLQHRRVCRDNWAEAVAAFKPTVAVLLTADPGSAEHEINGQWTAPCRPAYDQVFERELREQIGLLSSGGAHVVVATAAYLQLPYKPMSWFTNDDCQNDMVRRVVTADPHAVLADVFAWLCPQLDAPCDSHLSGMLLRPDGMHFRDASARLLAAFLIAQAQRQGVLVGVRDDTAEARVLSLPASSAAGTG